ncbi:MAG: hypothetical protein ABIO32_11810, partial [Ferruginibacter sp.]
YYNKSAFITNVSKNQSATFTSSIQTSKPKDPHQYPTKDHYLLKSCTAVRNLKASFREVFCYAPGNN